MKQKILTHAYKALNWGTILCVLNQHFKTQITMILRSFKLQRTSSGL